MKIGIIGAGRIGRVHAETLSFRLPRAEVKIITDIKREAAEKAAYDFKIPKVVNRYQDILNDPEITAVVICSSTDTHAEIIEASAQAKKHIFCEKPIDLTVQKIRSALTSIQKNDVIFQVGFNRRFDPSFKKIADAVRAGKIGTPHFVKITSRDPSPPPLEYIKVSGGMFLDMSIHDFDMARYVLDQEITEVFAFGGNLISQDIAQAHDIDSALISLKYENGTLGSIDNSRKAVYGYDQRLEVFGSEGCLLTENNTPTRAQYWDKSGQHQDLPLHFFLERYMDSYIAEMIEFIECIEQKRKPSCSGEDGLKALLLGLACKQSLKENRPIRLKEVSG